MSFDATPLDATPLDAPTSDVPTSDAPTSDAPTAASPSPERGPRWRRLAALPPAERADACAAAVAAEFKTALLMDQCDELPDEQNLFDLGLTSLRAVEAKERLEAALGCRIEVTELFDRPTVRGLVAHLAQGPLAELFPAPPPAPRNPAAEQRREHRAAVEELLNRLYRG